jgi:hypothetical protein
MDCDPSVALIVARVSAVTALLATGTDTSDAPRGTTTEVGGASAGMELVSSTRVPPLGACRVNLTSRMAA